MRSVWRVLVLALAACGEEPASPEGRQGGENERSQCFEGEFLHCDTAENGGECYCCWIADGEGNWACDRGPGGDGGTGGDGDGSPPGGGGDGGVGAGGDF